MITLDNSTSVEIPRYLIKLFYSANKICGNHRTKSDILAWLIYALALECGFVTLSHLNLNDERKMAKPWASYNNIFVNKFCDQLPSAYRCDNINGYETQLILYQLSNNKCYFIAREIGDGLCITLCVTLSNGEYFARSMYLSIGRYVIRTQWNNEKMLVKCFQNLKELSGRVKNEIYMPIRMALLADKLVTAHIRSLFAGLLGMPNELLLKLFTILSFDDRKNVSKSCNILGEIFDGFNLSMCGVK